MIAAPVGENRFSDPLFRSILAVTVLLGGLYVVLILYWGPGPVLLEAPWFIMAATSFTALASFTSAYLALGRYQVLRDPVSYWIGVGSFVSGGLAVFFVLTYPDFSPTGQGLIARLPSTSVYISIFVGFAVTLSRLAAVLSSWPGGTSLSGSRWIWSIAGLFSLTVIACALFVVFEDSLPPLVSTDGRIFPLRQVSNSLGFLLVCASVVLSTRRYLRSGDTLLGYVALAQLAFVFSVLYGLIGTRTYDLWYFLARLLQVGGTVTMMFGLLSEYVQLFRQELKRREGRLQTLIVNLPDVISHWDLSLRYTSVSPNVTQYVGVTPARFIGMTPRETGLFSEEALDAWETSSRKVLETARTEAMEYSVDTPSGAYYFHMRIVPELDARGRVVSLMGITQDVTERRQLEQRLLRAQRLEAAGRVASQVAHDFNNLLGPLVAYPELMKADLPPGHHSVMYCDVMLEAATRMADINENMMTLGRRGLMRREPVELNSVVRAALGQLPALPNALALVTDLDPDLLVTRGDPSQLQMMALNLLRNAVEAMGEVGRLEVRTQNVYLEQPHEGYSRIPPGEYLRLTISDTGHGMPQEIRDRIFDPFFTTRKTDKKRGSGLGLSIVQAIATDHGAFIDLETEMGKGAVFAVYLPVFRDVVKEVPEEEIKLGTEHVLVVDDDHLQREVAGALLRKLGYRVAMAASGEEAEAYVRDRSADLVLLDMVMPPGMDGAETYRRMLDVRPDQRAIILSGFAASERVALAQQLGAGPYLRKPVTLEKLARAVREELDR